jgi:hypothetical protein
MLDAAMNVHVERSLCVNIGFHFSWVYTWEWNPCCLFLFKRAGGVVFFSLLPLEKFLGCKGRSWPLRDVVSSVVCWTAYPHMLWIV